LRRAKQDVERDVALAWRAANFTAAASVGKLKDLSHYLDALKPQHESAPALEAIATFQALAERGLVTIREVPKKGGADGR
jgi:hypothetical protein